MRKQLAVGAVEKEVTLDAVIAAVESVMLQSRSDAEPVSAATTLEELGFSSLDLAEVVTTLQAIVGYELIAEDAANVTTVGDLVALRPR
jgi:acyl carrier protein